jgi:hypothetical protein
MNLYLNIQQQYTNMEVFKYTATGDLKLQQYSTTQYDLSNKESRGQKYWGPQIIKDTRFLQLSTHIMQYILRHIYTRVNNRLQVPHK